MLSVLLRKFEVDGALMEVDAISMLEIKNEHVNINLDSIKVLLANFIFR